MNEAQTANSGLRCSLGNKSYKKQLYMLYGVL